jgi:hypothetical protein
MPRRKKSLLKHLKHTFVASRENRFHPHLLKREAILAVLMLVVIIEGAVLGQEFITFKHTNYLASVLPGVVTALTNDARSADNLAILTDDPTLDTAAQAKANDMSAKGYFSHVSPDGTLPWHWFDSAGYDYEYAGENLAVNFDDSKQLVDAWMASPAHRANILGSHFTSIGVGIASGMYQGKSTIFVVQFFARPTPGSTPAKAPPASTPAVGAGKSGTSSSIVITDVPATTPIVTQKNGVTAPAVLGAETERISPLARLLASPLSWSAYAFGALALLFILAIVLGLIFHIRLPRVDALVAGLTVVVLLLGLALLNRGVIFSSLKLSEGGGSATSSAGAGLAPLSP